MEIPNKKANCPFCGTLLDGAVCVTDEDCMPQEGDITICAYCGEILIYEEGLFLRKLEDEEFDALRITDEYHYLFLKELHKYVKDRLIKKGKISK